MFMKKTSIASIMLLALATATGFLFAIRPSEALALFAGAVLASTLGMYFSIYQNSIYAPKLDLASKKPIINDFDIQVPVTSTVFPTQKSVRYHCNVLTIKNTGMTAAEGCKADLKVGERIFRLCWSVPEERPSATINAQSEEQLDVCAVLSNANSQDTNLLRRIAPTEKGWVYPPRDLGSEEFKAKLVISAKNANPKIIEITILQFENAIDGKLILVVNR
jgi:hypothetical protein